MEKMGKCQEEIIDELYQPAQLLRYGAHERQTIRCRVPRGAKGSPVIVWFHGGGLVNGSYECPQMLFNGRFLIAEPLYRFSPEATPPEILEDAAAAVGLLWKQLDELGGDRNKLFLGGISAGAWLSAMLGMDPDRLAPFGIDIRKLAGLLLVSGQMTTHFQLKADLEYPGDRFRPVIDRYAPLHFVAKELAPSSIQVNAIACGAIDTEMNQFLDEEERNALLEEIPAGRMGRAEEVGKLAYQLGSEDSYLTGQIIQLDGGWI